MIIKNSLITSEVFIDYYSLYPNLIKAIRQASMVGKFKNRNIMLNI